MGRLVKNNLAIKLMNGKISFNDDEKVIASQLVEPSYISFASALLFHNIIQQVPKLIECATTVNSRTYENIGIRYHKIPPSMLYGFKRHNISGSYIFVAEPEKAIIDSLYLKLISESEVKEFLKKTSKKRMNELLSLLKCKGSKKIKGMILQ